MVLLVRAGHLSEGREWTTRALAVAERSPPALRANAILGAASLARQQNQLPEAEGLCLSALELFRSDGDEVGTAKSLSQLGAVVERLGDYERAAQILGEALALLRKHGDVERISFTLIALGALKQITGHLDEAAHHYEESLGIGRSRHDGNAIATALVNLGEVQQLRGDLVSAARYYRESLEMYRELGLKIAIAYCLEVLAGIELERDRCERAPELLGAAEALREEINAPVEPFNRERLERDIARARAARGTDFAAAWQRGRELEAHEAVALALRDD
ncbi:MAG: tetratricopeptide repeat protein [Gammaproteobacteria bacterium]|nr:tetratricopeptide repeat protein [Gammaproteobacteria bacterium]